jgi:hypothetical protein
MGYSPHMRFSIDSASANVSSDKPPAIQSAIARRRGIKGWHQNPLRATIMISQGFAATTAPDGSRRSLTPEGLASRTGRRCDGTSSETSPRNMATLKNVDRTKSPGSASLYTYTPQLAARSAGVFRFPLI